MLICSLVRSSAGSLPLGPASCVLRPASSNVRGPRSGTMDGGCIEADLRQESVKNSGRGACATVIHPSPQIRIVRSKNNNNQPHPAASQRRGVFTKNTYVNATKIRAPSRHGVQGFDPWRGVAGQAPREAIPRAHRSARAGTGLADAVRHLAQPGPHSSGSCREAGTLRSSIKDECGGPVQPRASISSGSRRPFSTKRLIKRSCLRRILSSASLSAPSLPPLRPPRAGRSS